MDRMLQEMHCNECVGYFRVKLNTAMNYRVVVVCPNCGHEHHRNVVDGNLQDTAYGSSTTFKERIRPPKSAYSKESIAAKEEKRNGAVLSDEDDYKQAFREAYRRNYGRQRYIEAHGEA